MKDIIRVANKFPGFKDGLSINFVERSYFLRHVQKDSINCNIVKRDDDSCNYGNGAVLQGIVKPEFTHEGILKVAWYDELSFVPKGVPTLFIAQEFFDALPVHQFQKTDNGWCEVLVDNDLSKDGLHHLQSVLSPRPTIASRAYLKHDHVKHRAINDKGDNGSRSRNCKDKTNKHFLEISPGELL